MLMGKGVLKSKNILVLNDLKPTSKNLPSKYFYMYFFVNYRNNQELLYF